MGIVYMKLKLVKGLKFLDHLYPENEGTRFLEVRHAYRVHEGQIGKMARNSGCFVKKASMAGEIGSARKSSSFDMPFLFHTQLHRVMVM